jgi:hypothetical protein
MNRGKVVAPGIGRATLKIADRHRSTILSGGRGVCYAMRRSHHLEKCEREPRESGKGTEGVKKREKN